MIQVIQPLEHRPLDDFVLTAHNELERRYGLLDRELRQVTKRPEIDTEDRRTAPRYQASSRYHRAVSSKHNQQIAIVSYFSGGSGERTRRQILCAVVHEEVDFAIRRPLCNARRKLSRAWFVWLGDDTESRRAFLSHMDVGAMRFA